MHRATPSVDIRNEAVTAAVTSIVLTVLAIATAGVTRSRDPASRPETTVASARPAPSRAATTTATDRGGASA